MDILANQPVSGILVNVGAPRVIIPRAIGDLPMDLDDRWEAAAAFFDERRKAWDTAGERVYWETRNTADWELQKGTIDEDEHRERYREAHAVLDRHKAAVARRTSHYPSQGASQEAQATLAAAQDAAAAAARAVWEEALVALEARVAPEQERLNRENAAREAEAEKKAKEEQARTATEAHRKVEEAKRAAAEAQAALAAAMAAAKADDEEQEEIERAVAGVRARRHGTHQPVSSPAKRAAARRASAGGQGA